MSNDARTNATLHVHAENFQSEVIGSSRPVLVDFYAEWCGPCKALAPLVDEIATRYTDRAKVAKVDIDAAQELAQEYEITSIPTLIYFRDGQEFDRLVGQHPAPVIESKLDAIVAA